MSREAIVSAKARLLTRRSGLDIDPGTSFSEWALVGERLGTICSASAWALGDWLLFGERRFANRYRSAIDATGLDYKTLRNYAWVARSIELSRRRESLSF